MANGRYDRTPDDRSRFDWRDDRDDQRRFEGGRFRDEDQGYGRRGQEDHGREAEGRDRASWDRSGGERRRDWDPGNYGDFESGNDRGYGGDYGGRGMERGGQSGSQSDWGRGERQGGYESGYLGYRAGQAPYQRPGDQGMGGRGGYAGISGRPFQSGASHRGKGPKGYTRSDDRIREDVNDRLSDDDMLDASDITVTVSGGEVTLEGRVDSRQAKRAAEDCAETCSGVKHVQNNLRVGDKSGAGGDQSSGSGGQNMGKARKET